MFTSRSCGGRAGGNTCLHIFLCNSLVLKWLLQLTILERLLSLGEEKGSASGPELLAKRS